MVRHNTSGTSGAESSSQDVVNPSNLDSAPSLALVSFTADELEDRRAEWTSQEQAYHRQIHYQRPSSMPKDDPTRFHNWDYLKKGAIPQPPDGADVKVAGFAARCLTCIRYNRPCHGTGVENGECETCRKLHGGKNASKRTCVWINPSKNHWTYPAAHAAKGGRQNHANTVAGIKERLARGKAVKTRKSAGKKHSPATRVMPEHDNAEKRRTSTRRAQEAEGDETLSETEELDVEHDTPVATAFPPASGGPGPTNDGDLIEADQFHQEAFVLGETHIFQLQDEVSLQMMQGAASKMVQEETISDDSSANLQIFFDIATSWMSALYAGPAETLFERLDGIRALDHFVVTLSRMSQEGNGLSPQEVFNMASIVLE
ncbi:hypothetical protein LTR70_004949 [Exophiala xenobiotica]|uniref:Uncharacterized protein n=1 Tax=Lithohypha guttulata TaxID=1690604 RepID=A0ABR0KBI6_9EURO|nr:hypothetical protein LTR24_004518 [Lithohypha guttulata]KAK5319765.1 hypothetical protein LTR70_004949 [Exophiala xenobiotica]